MASNRFLQGIGARRRLLVVAELGADGGRSCTSRGDIRAAERPRTARLDVGRYTMSETLWPLSRYGRRMFRSRALGADSGADGVPGRGGRPASTRTLRSLFRLWFIFGFPAFGAVTTINRLKITRPASNGSDIPAGLVGKSRFRCRLQQVVRQRELGTRWRAQSKAVRTQLTGALWPTTRRRSPDFACPRYVPSRRRKPAGPSQRAVTRSRGTRPDLVFWASVQCPHRLRSSAAIVPTQPRPIGLPVPDRVTMAMSPVGARRTGGLRWPAR